MSDPKKEIKIENYFLMTKVIYIISNLLMIIALTFVFWFLYHNVFITINQADSLTNLKKEVIEKSPEKEKFYLLLEETENKKDIPTTTSTDKLKNTFSE